MKRTSLLQFNVDALAGTYAELDRWCTAIGSQVAVLSCDWLTG
jgi:hypothetical protein